MELEQAIRISKIICQADEGRLPMILSVLEKAGVNIDGLEELEEWKALTSQRAQIKVSLGIAAPPKNRNRPRGITSRPSPL